MFICHFHRPLSLSHFLTGEPPSWLQEMIEHPTWRALFYQLAEEFPECLMLNFTIKSISDAGFQGEITSVTTASQQIEVIVTLS